MNAIRQLAGLARAPFLALAPIMVLLGYSTVVYRGLTVHSIDFMLMMICAVAGHIGVNALNEYTDFQSGLDSLTTKTPFSGGSGTLQVYPNLSQWALRLFVGSSVVVLTIAAYFVWFKSMLLLPIMIVGMLLVIFYTSHLTRNWFLCLVAPGVGFGTVMVIGTDVVLTDLLSIHAVMASLVPFFLVNNLLLLNQYPDIEADRYIGRTNVLIAFGVKSGAILYLLSTLSAGAVIITGIIWGIFPIHCCSAIVPLVFALPLAGRMSAYTGQIERIIPALKINTFVVLSTPLLLSLCLLV